MAFLEWREKHYKVNLAADTTDVVIAALPAGSALMVFGANVTDAAATGAVKLTDGAGIDLMTDADLDPNTTGLKRNTTPGPFFFTTARSITADITTILADVAEITFLCAVAKVHPGAGEV